MKRLSKIVFSLGLLLISCSEKRQSSPFSRANRGENGENRLILVDSNRDTRLNELDTVADDWSWQGSGALVLPNLDDDNRDGIIDCKDDEVNGANDERDLARVEIALPATTAQNPETLSVHLAATNASADIHWFLKTNTGWKKIPNDLSLRDVDLSNKKSISLGIESCQFATREWDGFMSVRVESESGAILDSARLRVSPFLMLPNTQHMETLYVSRDSSGTYGNRRMLIELPLPVLLSQVALKVYETDAWQEMWMQDTMEIGYAEAPGTRMHVVLNAPRGQDRFGLTRLAPDVGYLEVAQPRAQANPSDGWLDWFGNLEVSPATEKFPWGRIYYGKNPDTENTLHPDIVAFLEAQELQKPVSLDTGWLYIKHVDEMLTFWPKGRSSFVAVLPSPRKAAQLLNDDLDSFNATIQERIDAVLSGSSGLAETFGFSPEQIMTVPLLYSEGDYGAISRWSNPVNSVAVNRVLLFGRTDLPKPVISEISKTVFSLGLLPTPVEDSAYQNRLGNVHCGSNSQRSMPTRPFWTQP
ncbi:hypothetical protein EBU99_07415 [bacterium]|nr:hypothetical protein [bacterium]